MRKIFFAVLVTFGVMASCTDSDRSERVLQGAGYKDISIDGYDPWGCGKGDDTCTEFHATGPTGVRVHGVVGCGYNGCSKSCTVRIK